MIKNILIISFLLLLGGYGFGQDLKNNIHILEKYYVHRAVNSNNEKGKEYSEYFIISDNLGEEVKRFEVRFPKKMKLLLTINCYTL